MLPCYQQHNPTQHLLPATLHHQISHKQTVQLLPLLESISLRSKSLGNSLLSSNGFRPTKQNQYPMQFLLRRFDFLIQVHLPKLGARVGSSFSRNWLYAEDWFKLAFAQFPYPLAVRIWDVFLYQGYDFLLKFGLALLSFQEKKLLTLNTTKLAESLASYHILFRKPMLKKGPDRLIQLADSFDLRPV